ncbi:hypothetical protein SAMN02746064_00191 [Alkalibacter saccharofermentans DSM 14828]|uniref:Uncharacterized protein n=1 Tax=Alkalibacter saccharofermentans DSM 14828 TaxID=1120975 RepID=A0A1M4SB25_9FIRM|nr:hypothetical protein SAMN02746064_00191 [Alkalibacter saccharofermentans DSM 14828]
MKINSIIKTVVTELSATVKRLFSIYASSIATVIPADAKMGLPVENSIAGKVMEPRTA